MSELFFARNLRLLIVFAGVFFAFPAFAAAQALEWEVVNPFRFIRDTKANAELRAAFETPDGNTAAGLERKLQEWDDAMVDAERAKGTKIYYSGWFSRLAENNYAKTCWNAETLKFRDDGDCKDYVHPSAHKVRIWIKDRNIPRGAQIDWYLGDAKVPAPEPCENERSDCAVLSIPYPAKIRVSVRVDGAEIASVEVEVADKLIVGLGDSYASGEGNPDVPAHFEDGRTDIDIIFGRLKGQKDTFLRREPKRDEDSEVYWLDRRCHRSMYSYQFKTALQIALADRKKAVTFVSYSCSGAETKNVIDKWKKAKENLKKKDLKREYNKVRPQLDVLREALCAADGKGVCTKAPREIDYLLLSIGGNDIGFAEYAANIITSGLIRKLIGKKPRADTGEKVIGTIDKHYGLLRGKLPGKDLNIKDCSPGDPCARILLTVYPEIMNNENGELCKADRGEFDSPFGRDPDRAERIAKVKEKVFDPLRKAQKKAEAAWTLVLGHSDKYLTHGFCAQGDPKKIAENFIIPIRNDNVWFPYEPKKYKAYESRERWLRLPVDSKLTTDQVIQLGPLRLRLFYVDVRSNVMHPTAEGLSHTADANVRKIQEINLKEKNYGWKFGQYR